MLNTSYYISPSTAVAPKGGLTTVQAGLTAARTATAGCCVGGRTPAVQGAFGGPNGQRTALGRFREGQGSAPGLGNNRKKRC